MLVQAKALKKKEKNEFRELTRDEFDFEPLRNR